MAPAAAEPVGTGAEPVALVADMSDPFHPANEAVNDPKKVIVAECQALLIEMELARNRVARLAAAVENIAYDEDAESLRQVVHDYSNITRTLDWICSGKQILERLEAAKPAEPPKMVRA